MTYEEKIAERTDIKKLKRSKAYYLSGIIVIWSMLVLYLIIVILSVIYKVDIGDSSLLSMLVICGIVTGSCLPRVRVLKKRIAELENPTSYGNPAAGGQDSFAADRTVTSDAQNGMQNISQGVYQNNPQNTMQNGK